MRSWVRRLWRAFLSGQNRPRRRPCRHLLTLEILEERDVPSITFAEYPIPKPNTNPQGITSGPDGALWFTEFAKKQIGRVTPAGVFTQYKIPTSNPQPQGIVPGPDGALWFTDSNTNDIGRVTTAGLFTLYTVPTGSSNPQDIASGPDGALWFTERNANKIGRITTAGVFTEYTIPTGSSNPQGITSGPDGALWFTEFNRDRIGRITTAGVFTEYTIPTTGAKPADITSGPDGALWFTEFNGDRIGRVTTAGLFTEYTVPTSSSNPQGITSGPDGALWFTEFNRNRIGRITTAGAVAEYAIPTGGSKPIGITSGPNNALWFTESSANQIGTLNLGGTTPTTTALTSSANPAGYGQTVTFTATVSGGSGTPTGSVTFQDGVTVLGTATLDASGQARFSTSALSTGSHSITAVYGGDANDSSSTSAPLSQTIQPDSTTTLLVSSANPADHGQSITFTATVSANAPGSGTPTGSVTFEDGAVVLGSALLNGSGQASFSTSALTAGSHSITAVYGGDSNDSSSTSAALSETVQRTATTTLLVSSANPADDGQTVTFTATVSANAPGSGFPTGSVTFQDGAVVLGSALLNGSGQASFSTSTLTAGGHSITAVYNGDADDSASRGQLNQVVNSNDTVTLPGSPSPGSDPGPPYQPGPSPPGNQNTNDAVSPSTPVTGSSDVQSGGGTDAPIFQPTLATAQEGGGQSVVPSAAQPEQQTTTSTHLEPANRPPVPILVVSATNRIGAGRQGTTNSTPASPVFVADVSAATESARPVSELPVLSATPAGGSGGAVADAASHPTGSGKGGAPSNPGREQADQRGAVPVPRITPDVAASPQPGPSSRTPALLPPSPLRVGPLPPSLVPGPGTAPTFKTDLLLTSLASAGLPLESPSRSEKVIDVGFATGLAVSVGYVVFSSRGGAWLFTLLTARPLWKQFDPLEILFAWEAEKKRRGLAGGTGEEQEGETLQSLVEGEKGP